MDYIAFSQVLLIGFTAALASKLAMVLTVDMKKVTELKKKIKEIRKETKQLKPGTKEHSKKYEEMTDINLELTKMQLKPTIFTFIPFILLFMWMREMFGKAPAFIILPFSLPIIGNDIGWLLTYLISTMLFSSIINKIIDRRWGKNV